MFLKESCHPFKGLPCLFSVERGARHLCQHRDEAVQVAGQLSLPLRAHSLTLGAEYLAAGKLEELHGWAVSKKKKRI